ncbi:putative SAM-dependent methyltransferase, type 11 [Tenacibaculum sp. 190524A02b]|uniref:SAM-dependent methyltransferase n=1 Tax=Tenacibaculum vairaonense TaxID=3137860 RepID=UPI0032B294A8
MQRVIGTISSLLDVNQEITYEWSIRIKANQTVIRDKYILWLPKNTFKHIPSILKVLNCPEKLIETQKKHAQKTVNIGLGISNKENQCNVLYIHYLEKNTLKDIYKAYQWNTSKKIEKQQYHFFFFPETPKGIKPESLVSTRLLKVYYKAYENSLLKKSAGFWLREHRQTYNQICISYPWQPKLSEIFNSLSLFSNFNKNDLLIKQYKNFHFKHLAFNRDENNPHLTVYFSGKMQLKELSNLNYAKKTANNHTKTLHKYIKQGILDKTITNLPGNNTYLSDFYSTDGVEYWKKVLGKNMHYHFGLFTENNNVPNLKNNTAFDNAIETLFKFIPSGSSIYDMGCGWGGPAKLLTEKNANKVTGITLSKTQFKYCNDIGIQTRLGNIENTLPPGYFDTLLMMESLEHIHNKYQLLKNLRYFSDQLIIRTHCQNTNTSNLVFGNTMKVISSDLLVDILTKAGWKIKHLKNRRMESLPTIDLWKSRFKNIPKQNDPHFEYFRNFVYRVSNSKKEWAKNNPLIEIVAVKS